MLFMTDKVEITEKGLKILKIRKAALMGLSQKDALEKLLAKAARADTFKLVESMTRDSIGPQVDAMIPANTLKFSLDDRQRLALRHILDELSAGNEPTVVQVAEKLGIPPKKLGTSLVKIGIKSKPIRKNNNVIRAYGFELKPLIEPFLG